MEASALRVVSLVMDRLYSERTMSGDDMRDYAQKLQWVLDNALDRRWYGQDMTLVTLLVTAFLVGLLTASDK